MTLKVINGDARQWRAYRFPPRSSQPSEDWSGDPAGLQRAMADAFGDHPIVGDVRGVGMLAALEFSANPGKREHFDPALKVGPRIAAAALDENLIARAMPQGDILGFAPPLIATPAQVDEIVARARRAVDKVTDALVREGALKAMTAPIA